MPKMSLSPLVQTTPYLVQLLLMVTWWQHLWNSRNPQSSFTCLCSHDYKCFTKNIVDGIPLDVYRVCDTHTHTQAQNSLRVTQVPFKTICHYSSYIRYIQEIEGARTSK